MYVRVPEADARQPATVMHNVAPRLSGTRWPAPTLRPPRRTHPAQLLTELGADADEISRLSDQGSIECG